MTTAINEQLCRITVVGPVHRADLAVPVSTTVAALMPVLLWHAAGEGADAEQFGTGWVLQRLGKPPFDPSGTPESLDWLEGEELYLRPVDDPLPELDFDDLADGISTIVNRRADRWQPHYRRYLFMGLSAVLLAIIAAVVWDRGPDVVQLGVGAGFTAFLLLASVSFAKVSADRAMSLLFGVAACGFAGLTVVNAMDGAPDAVVVDRAGVLVGSAVVASVALALVVVQRLWVPAIPFAPLLAILLTALSTVLALWLHLGRQLSPPTVGGIAGAVLLGVIVFAPKLVLRSARLRGPQLPKTGEELQFDNQPEVAAVVERRANDADSYLSVAMVCVSMVLPFMLYLIVQEPGWIGWTLVMVLSSGVLLRARSFLGVWQRVSLVSAGTGGYTLVILKFSGAWSPGWRGVLVAALVVVLAMLVVAALRPWPRRLLPIWEFTATVLDVVTGIAVLPLVFKLAGMYGWARGLMG